MTFQMPLFPPVMELSIKSFRFDLTKVLIGKTVAYLGNPRSGAAYCKDPLVVLLQGDTVEVRGKRALQFIDAAAPQLAARAISEMLRNHLATQTWDENEWEAVRKDVRQLMGGIPISPRQEQMTAEEEKILVHAGISEQAIAVCKANAIRPMPTPQMYLAMQIGPDFEIRKGAWNDEAQMIALVTNVSAKDVDMARELKLRFAQKAA